MPGYKVVLQDGGEICAGLTCSYCKLVLKDPVQTSESGLRLCRECWDKVSKSLSYASELDPNDKIWPDVAVKKEIGNLKVKCDNYKVGCDWKGFFKELMQHTQECQYVKVECDCGRQVLLIEMELHLNKECPQRLIDCKDCGEKISFSDLQNHNGLCPSTVRVCRSCGKELPTCQLVDHMTRECKLIRCVCKEGGSFEMNDQNFDVHLQDISKLGEHLKPVISECSKMPESMQEMSRRMSILERKNEVHVRNANQANERIEYLEMKATKHETNEQMLKEKVEALEKENSQLTQLVDKNHHRLFKQMDQSVEKVSELDHDLEKLKTETNNNHAQMEAQLEGINLAVTSSSKTDLLDKPPSTDVIKQLENKVLELEKILNAVSGARTSDVERISELELQLQAPLASTHNGTFLWRIPEVHQRIRDARTGRITSIYSPPFYTGRNGYKMCIRAYLNGDGSGYHTHLSIFFVLMKGKDDPLLQWPFDHKVSLILVDQDHKEHLVQSFKPNGQSSSFQRPKTDMNVASGCPEFTDLSILDNTSYVKDDVMYIKAIVDTSKILHP